MATLPRARLAERGRYPCASRLVPLRPELNSRSVFLASPSTIIVFGLDEELVLDAREAGVHAALEHDDRSAPASTLKTGMP